MKHTHQEISDCAQMIWNEQGRPRDCDVAIWYEAERMLAAGTATAAAVVSAPLPEGQSVHALAEKAAFQRKAARAPQQAEKTAPKATPAETGKPLWSKPHSR